MLQPSKVSLRAIFPAVEDNILLIESGLGSCQFSCSWANLLKSMDSEGVILLLMVKLAIKISRKLPLNMPLF
mgnify:CR=1 FL=1